MSAADFLDTNVLVYSIDATHPGKRQIAQTLVGAAIAGDSAVISFQVVQETLQIITRKVRVIATDADAGTFLASVLVPLWKIHPTPELYQRALDVQTRQGFSFYDSLIVAAALQAGCKRLLTEDLQHGQRVGTLRIENPFRH